MTTYFDMGRGHQRRTEVALLTFPFLGAINLTPGAINFVGRDLDIRVSAAHQGLVDGWMEEWERDYCRRDPLYAEMDIGGIRIQDIGAYLEGEGQWLKAR